MADEILVFFWAVDHMAEGARALRRNTERDKRDRS